MQLFSFTRMSLHFSKTFLGKKKRKKSNLDVCSCRDFNPPEAKLVVAVIGWVARGAQRQFAVIRDGVVSVAVSLCKVKLNKTFEHLVL